MTFSKSEAYDPTHDNNEGGIAEAIKSGEYEIPADAEEFINNLRIHPSEVSDEDGEISPVIVGKKPDLQSEIQGDIDVLRKTIEDRAKAKEERAVQEVLADEEMEARDTEAKKQIFSYVDEKTSVFDRINSLQKTVDKIAAEVDFEKDKLTEVLERLRVIQEKGNAVDITAAQKEASALTRKISQKEEMLLGREETLAALSKFEEKLWGNTLADLKHNTIVLGANIENCESRQDLLRVFDTWGALPGKDAHSRPLTDREAVKNFLDRMETEPLDSLREDGKLLFQNEDVLRVVFELLKREREQAEKDEELRVVDAQTARDNYRKGAQFSREPVEDHFEKEHKALIQEEIDLERAKDILKSPVFRFAPFLLNLTSRGKEKLAVLKRTKLYPKAVGSGNRNLELALSFRLKDVRERYAAMHNIVDQKFLHDPIERRKSEDRAHFYAHAGTNDMKREYINDLANLEAYDTRGVEKRHVQDSLKRQSNTSFFSKLFDAMFNFSSKSEESTETPDNFITPDQIQNGRDMPGTYEDDEELPEVAHITMVPNDTSQTAEAVYTEASTDAKNQKKPKKEIEKKKKGKATKEQKRRKSKRFL